jgi:hypothetical protein
MKQRKIATWMIHVGAIVKLEVPADMDETDINDLVGFFVLLQDVSDTSDRMRLEFRIININTQEIRIEPFIGETKP